MKQTLIKLTVLLLLVGCGGTDYTPVYFPGGAGETGKSESKGKKEPSTSIVSQCKVHLEATLCVKIKGDNIEVGTDPAEPMCSETPPILLEIQQDKIFLKGSKFPDISVHVKLKGVDTPLTINGKGNTDGSGNVGEGTWSPSGDIEINNFSFYINVLGEWAKVSNLDLTTDQAKTTPHLSDIRGFPASPDGEIRLVTGTVLGHLIDAADKFLLGASLQATFEGRLDPPLSSCLGEGGTETKGIVISKLHPTATGKWREEPIPEGNILEVSKGTYISQGEQNIGPSYESTAYFKMIHEGNESVAIQFPSQVGPFHFLMEGKTKRTLSAGKEIDFQILFRPTQSEVPEAGEVKLSLRLGRKTFYLYGVALDPKGASRIDQTDESGVEIAPHIQSLTFDSFAVPATTVKKYFRCKKIDCDGVEAITQCTLCIPPDVQGCLLIPINTEENPMEERAATCESKYPDSSAMMNLDLTTAEEIPLNPLKQILTIRNHGVKNLTVTEMILEEISNAVSRGEFQILPKGFLVGTSLEKARSVLLPITLPPYVPGEEETSLFITVTYLPKDLLGFDGKQASSGREVLDRGRLLLKTDSGEQVVELTGKTKIQEVPALSLYFATATGYKVKEGNDSFIFEEVTGQTEDLAVPVFLKLADTATQGLRIAEIKIIGKDNSHFEWLDSQEEVNNRQPASGKGKRCSIPIFDPTTGRQIDEHFNLKFVEMGGKGLDLKPGAFTPETMPLFGCLNFHRDPSEPIAQKLYEANLKIIASQLDPQGKPIRTTDNIQHQTELNIPIIAVIDPMKGKYVLRITQTLFALLQPISPTISGMPAKQEVEAMLREGRGSKQELGVMLGALILDPFDEMEITGSQGVVVSTPGDGVTAVFRQLDARPSSIKYDEEFLHDNMSLLHDSDLPLGEEGVFYDYDFPEHPLPKPLKVNAWRIFTGSLSYPGPLHPRAPIDKSQCEVIDPCDPNGLFQFSEAGVGADGKGACAFFHTSGGRYHSPAFEPIIQGKPHDLCEVRDQPQEILAMNTGHYKIDGSITVTDLGLRFWGPNFFSNPYGPLGKMPALDEVFHIAFTTEILKPKNSEKDLDVLPDVKIDFSKWEHKLNLTETNLTTPPVCPNTTDNVTVGGKTYSSWRYFRDLIYKDEAGEAPAGCREPGENDFTGGTAFFKGRRIDPQTGIFTIVSAAKFGSREELSLAFKDTMIFIALNGWLCDPQGDEANFEGVRCFDPEFHERDEKAQITYMEGTN